MEKTKNIPEYDPQTGELNPYYKELTGKENPMNSIHNVELHNKIYGKQIKYSTKIDNRQNTMEHNNIVHDEIHISNEKWRKTVKFVKIGVRVIGYGLIPFNLTMACLILILGEILGIVEETVR